MLLGTDPPWLPTPLLVRTTALFGISEGSTRTALSRMVTAGEAEADDGGYRLVGRLVGSPAAPVGQPPGRHPALGRHLGARHRRRRHPPRRRRTEPTLRDALGALRLVELREGVWGRPDNLDPDRSADAAAGGRRDGASAGRGARPDPAPDVASAVRTSTAWSTTRSRPSGDEMRRLLAAARARRHRRPAPTGSSLSAAVLRHLQADPLLPDALLPPGWPGAALRAEYDRYDAAYRSTLRAWFRAAR